MWAQTDYVIRSQSPIFQISDEKCRFFSVEIHFLNCSILSPTSPLSRSLFHTYRVCITDTHTHTYRDRDRETKRSTYIYLLIRLLFTSFGPWAQYNKYLLDQYTGSCRNTQLHQVNTKTSTLTNTHTHIPQMSECIVSWTLTFRLQNFSHILSLWKYRRSIILPYATKQIAIQIYEVRIVDREKTIKRDNVSESESEKSK